MATDKKLPKLDRLKAGAIFGAVAAVLMEPRNPSVWATAIGMVMAAFTGKPHQAPDAE